MTDLEIKCQSCGKDFIWAIREQEFFQKMGFLPPRRCQECRVKDKRYIDTNAIIKFVQTIEDHKHYKREVRLVFAHLVEEVGELSREIWEHEKDCLVIERPDAKGIGSELIDIVFLACYLADILGIKLNDLIPERMSEIREQYGVR